MKQAENTVSGVKKDTMLKIPFNQIELQEGLNIREDYGNIKELADSIRENGVRVPLNGYKKRGEDLYVVVDGHRRYKALKILADEGAELFVPFLVQNKENQGEQMIVDMFITNDGKPLNPLEQAEGVLRLKNFGWETKDIADKIAKSQTYVENLYKLSQAPKKAKSLVKKGVVSATFIIQRLRDETIDAFLENTDEWLAENETGENGESAKPAKKKKTAKITQQDYVLNSFKEFKRFAKNYAEIFPNEEVKSVYDFLTEVAHNKLTYDDMVNYFMDGKKPNTDEGTTSKKSNKKKTK